MNVPLMIAGPSPSSCVSLQPLGLSLLTYRIRSAKPFDAGPQRRLSRRARAGFAASRECTPRLLSRVCKRTV